MKILLIEDQLVLGDAVSKRLIRSGYAVDWVTTLAEGRAAVGKANIVLLDLGLPDGDGIAFLKEAREMLFDGPIIILTARDQVSDCIDGLNAGADDYLTKPFNLGVLVARLEAVRRRYAGKPSTLQRIGNLEIDYSMNQVRKGGHEIRLTLRELAIFRLLADRAGQVVGKTDIENALYRNGHEVKSNTVEVYISRLRRKLGAGTIATSHGNGYELKIDP